MATHENLQRLLQPRTVAVFGGDSAAAVVRQCRAIGYTGEIWAVSPTRKELAGIPCVASIDDLPGVPDASFVAAPPAASLEIIAALSSRGAPGAVCFAAGFAEAGHAGEALQAQLREAAGSMAVMGPNCHGFVNYLDGVALWPDEHGGERSSRGVALITQSGNIALNLTMQQRALDYAYVITIGNNSVLGLHHYIDMLLEDSRVSAIAMHIEGIQDVAAFSAAAIRALEKGIPLIALKSGRSSLGAQITMSHTGSLAGSDRLYSALFKRVGVARCDTLPQFVETMKFLSHVGPLDNETVGSLSCSGGEASLVADHAERLGLQMPPLSAASAASLKDVLGERVHVANPLDYHLYIWGNYDLLRECFTQFLSNSFACTLLVLDYPAYEGADQSKWITAEQALVAALEQTGARAVLVASLPETLPLAVQRRLAAAGIAPMQGIEDCLFAIRAAAGIGAAQARAGSIRPIQVTSSLAWEAESLDEATSKRMLADFGVRIPASQVCAAAETGAVAAELGYPVVLKAVAAELAHKSEAGAVAIGLADEVALQRATERMAEKFDAFLVEQMIAPVVAELIVGVHRDQTFGLSLLIGAGGTLVELLDDTVSLLLPASREEIEEAVASLKSATLIGGYRAAAAGDMNSVVDAISQIAEFALANEDRLLELDVNPLLITPDGAVAADAFIRLLLPPAEQAVGGETYV